MFDLKRSKLPKLVANLLSFWQIASGTYKFTSVRTYIRMSVRTSVRYSEISESVHRNFLKFGKKLGLPKATEGTFGFCPKILFSPFWANLGPKISFLAQNEHFCQFLGNES